MKAILLCIKITLDALLFESHNKGVAFLLIVLNVVYFDFYTIVFSSCILVYTTFGDSLVLFFWSKISTSHLYERF